MTEPSLSFSRRRATSGYLQNLPTTSTANWAIWTYGSSRKKPGPGVRFIIWENDVDVRHSQMLVGLRTGQARKQVSDDIQLRAMLVVCPNHDPRR